MIAWLLACAEPPIGVAGAPEPIPTPTEPAEPPPSYEARGPWNVGTQRISVTGTDALVLPVQIWYPTLDAPGAPILYDNLFLGDATEGAAPDCAEVHPLVAFSHGSAGIRWQSAFWTEHLASWGYVVVAPDHVGNTFFDVSGDLNTIAVRRPTDVRDAVDWLFAANDPWVGCVDPAAGYAIAGHSFGGTTTLALAGALANDPTLAVEVDLSDDRVWAAVAMAPWDGSGFIDDGVAEIDVPTMFLTGALDEITPIEQVTFLWDGLAVEPRYFGVFPEGGHFSFSPVACVVEVGDGCGDGYLDLDVFGERVAAAATAFVEGARGVDRALEGIPLDAAEIEWTVVP